MKSYALLAVLPNLLMLGACATASFSPPSVNLENEMSVRGSNYSFGARCMPSERLDNGKKPIPIAMTVKGTQSLIDNFVYMYRCRAHSAANGRQAFEVPSLLIGAGAAAAMAFGAPPEVAIGGGAATATLNGGKNYYAPKMKAAIYDSALDALLCIKAEAVGIDPITLTAISAMESGGAQTKALAGAGVQVTAEQRYFAIVTASLLSVERVVAQRLSNVGTFDPAGVIAEIKTLADEVKEKKDDAEATADNQAKTLVTDGASAGATLTAKAASGAADETKVAQTIVQIETLQPKLQQCVVRAKI